jgi:hypothetical protein
MIYQPTSQVLKEGLAFILRLPRIVAGSVTGFALHKLYLCTCRNVLLERCKDDTHLTCHLGQMVCLSYFYEQLVFTAYEKRDCQEQDLQRRLSRNNGSNAK